MRLAKLNASAKAAVSIGVLLLCAGAYYVMFYSDMAQSIERAQSREKELHKSRMPGDDCRM